MIGDFKSGKLSVSNAEAISEVHHATRVGISSSEILHSAKIGGQVLVQMREIAGFDLDPSGKHFQRIERIAIF